MSDPILHTDGDPHCECNRCKDQEKTAQEIIDECDGDEQ